MQLASHGARAAARDVSHFAHSAPLSRGAARSMHRSAFQPVKTSGLGKKLLSTARNVFNRAIVNLTTPGIGVNNVASMSRSIHGGLPNRMPTIQQRMTAPMRFALSQPLRSHYLPRGPTMPRNMTQVGLGTARNFSSGRVLFQNVAQNVPVAARAFVEADIDLHLQKEKQRMKRTISKEQKKSRRKVSVDKENRTSFKTPMKVTEESEEVEKYFAAPVEKPVTTALLIPLAPTPSSRMPLPSDTLPHESLLPLQTLASMHNAHELHALRVSTLFTRLDAANVWDRGVTCSGYGTRSYADGVCTVLKVEFEGWTEAEVRSVIGESGTGWCTLQETNLAPDKEDIDHYLSSVSSPTSEVPVLSEPSHSVVLPTLDFSASFAQRTFSRTASEESLFSDIRSEMDSISEVSAGSDHGWLMFSSDFARRAGHNDTPEPREFYF